MMRGICWSNMNYKYLKNLFLILAFFLALIFFKFYRFDVVFQIDFLQHWSSSKLLLTGQNPYDLELNYRLQSEVKGFQSPEFFNAPYCLPTTLLFTFWLGFFEFQTAADIWFVLSLVTMTVSAFLLIGEFKTSKISTLAYLCILSFPPIMIVPLMGQISFLLLFFFTLFFLEFYRKKELTLLSLFLLSFTLIKPHSLYLVYVVVLMELINSKQYLKILYAALFVICLHLPLLIFTPDIFSQYVSMMTGSSNLVWSTTTLADNLSKILHLSSYSPLRTLIPGISLVFMLFYFRNKHLTWINLLFLLPITLITAPYGWLYEQLLLLVPLVVLISNKQLPIAYYYQILLLNLSVFCLSLFHTIDVFIYYPVFIMLFLYVCLKHYFNPCMETEF